ncbi:MAG: hypothetical protein SV966_03390 [Actinomycetota bacterium]|nr:hypothetical protein [Actinomycetota bacterium]
MKTAHLANEPGKRQYAVTKLCDPAPRPALPEITDAMILDGTWAEPLVAMAETVDAGLAALLARAHPPNANALRGQISRSERLLYETLDRPALALVRRLDRDEAQPLTAPTTTTDPRAELAALGINV